MSASCTRQSSFFSTAFNRRRIIYSIIRSPIMLIMWRGCRRYRFGSSGVALFRRRATDHNCCWAEASLRRCRAGWWRFAWRLFWARSSWNEYQKTNVRSLLSSSMGKWPGIDVRDLKVKIHKLCLVEIYELLNLPKLYLIN